MRTKTRLSLTAIAILMTTAGARASAPAGPPPETKALGRLVGAWKGTASMTMGSDKADGIKVTWTCRAISARNGVACDTTMTGLPGMDRYEETDLFGYDPGDSKLHWFTVSNAGETHDHVAGPWNGQSAQFVYTGTRDGKPLKEMLDMSFKGPNAATVEIRSQTYVDGKLTAVLQGTAHK